MNLNRHIKTWMLFLIFLGVTAQGNQNQLHCQKYNEAAGACTVCENLFHIDNKGCSLFSKSGCSNNIPNSEICSLCGTDCSLLLIDNSCVPNKAINCQDYNELDNTCNQCKSLYSLDESSKCVVIDDPHCVASVGLLPKCTSCVPGYIPSPSEGRCIPREQTGCLELLPNSNQCAQCILGFLNINGFCELDKSRHCLTYSDPATNTCTACETGYLFFSNGLCRKKDCFHCDQFIESTSKCQQCSNGYYIDATGYCQDSPNGLNCLIYSQTDQKCQSCERNFLPNPQGSCQPRCIPRPCRVGSILNQANCLCECQNNCDEGFTLNQNNCQCECTRTCSPQLILNPTSCACVPNQCISSHCSLSPNNEYCTCSDPCDYIGVKVYNTPKPCSISCPDGASPNVDCRCPCSRSELELYPLTPPVCTIQNFAVSKREILVHGYPGAVINVGNGMIAMVNFDPVRIDIINTVDMSVVNTNLLGQHTIYRLLLLTPDVLAFTVEYEVREIRFWRFKTESTAFEIIDSGHLSVIHDLQKLENGKFASASEDDTIKIWNADHSLFRTIQCGLYRPRNVFLYSPGKVIAANGSGLTLYNYLTGEIIRYVETGNFIDRMVPLENGKFAVGGASQIEIYNHDLFFERRNGHESYEFKEVVYLGNGLIGVLPRLHMFYIMRVDTLEILFLEEFNAHMWGVERLEDGRIFVAKQGGAVIYTITPTL